MDYTDLTVYDQIFGTPLPTLPSEIISQGGIQFTQTGNICCQTDNNGVYVNDCICFATCNWRLTGTTFQDATTSVAGEYYLHFVDPQGGDRIVTPDGCNCINPSMATQNVIDPYTGQVGYGCKITLADWNSNAGYTMTSSYADRLDRIIGCSDDNFTQQ